MVRSRDGAVDVFSAIDAANLWLMFRPLENIKGALCSASGGTGILVNSNHPFHLQRFTAAHELGHYRLGHQEAVDFVEDEGAASNLCRLSGTELEAESFASYFLMPESAVRRAVNSIRCIEPVDAYQASLRLQVSYAAMVSRLQDLKIVSYAQAQKLRAVRPKDIKESLTHGLTGNLGRRHVWLLRGDDTDSSLRPLVGDEIHLLLEEHPAAGYSWHETPDSNAPVRQVATDDHFQDGLFGAATETHIAYEVTTAGSGHISLAHSRSWQGSVGTERFEVMVKAESSIAAGDGQGLMCDQLDLLAARTR